MSKHTRTSRRRRIAVGLGATGGGLLAAAFMPMGIAMADPGLFPIDTETSPDPASDFTNVADIFPSTTDAGNAPGIFDTQFNLDNSALAAQIDYDIDNHEAFSFGALDGLGSNTVPSTFAPADTPTTGYDPFEDAFIQNTGGTSGLYNGISYDDAKSYDYAISQLLPSSEAAQLNSIAETGTGTIVTPPVVPDNDPAADFVQLFDHNAFANPVSPDTPTDFLGQLATLDDQFLNAFGLGGPLDQFVDTFTGSFSTAVDPLGGLGGTSADLLTGLTGTGADTLTGLGGTGADAFTNIFADLAGIF